MIEPRCQPEPDKPFSIDALAAASSRCIGCGSNSAAKAKISSRVTWRGPNVPKWPGVKSSKVSVVIYRRSGLRIAAGKPECGRYLRQSQPVHPHGWFARGEYRHRRSSLTCPKQFSELALCHLESGLLTRRRTIDARFSGSVSVGPLHHAHDHQDLLLAGHRLDRAVRPVRDLFGSLPRWRSARSADSSCCLSSIAGVVVGVVFSRIAAEFILIVFRINEHLGAIRDQGQMR